MTLRVLGIFFAIFVIGAIGKTIELAMGKREMRRLAELNSKSAADGTELQEE